MSRYTRATSNYGRTLFIYAYYQPSVPVLMPGANTTGFVPVLSDPRVRLVDQRSIAAEGERAFADGRIVWFVGSRMGLDGPVLQRSLEQRGTLTRKEVRVDAMLLRSERRAPVGPSNE